MSQVNAYEQYILELINAERASTGAQPLAFNAQLNDAAEIHSGWMLNSDTFSHTGNGGSTAGQRMIAAGYSFSGSWGWAENIGWVSTRQPAGLQDEAALLHTNLMSSTGHRANILNASYREIGIGFEVGDFQGWDAAMVTQNFAYSAGSLFLTGVAFDDLDGDRAYDIGEGLGAYNLSVTNATGQVWSTTTEAAGGYSLKLAAGAYTATFSAAGFASQSFNVAVGSSNVKLDLIDPVAGTTPPPPPPPPASTMIEGTSRADTLIGGSLDEVLRGLGGNDTLDGGSGKDVLDGGTGVDVLRGGLGDDRLEGGVGKDSLDGGAGDDWLFGGADRDSLTGGEGFDRFAWASAADAGKGTVRDLVLDFTQGQDRIDLSAIDAIGATATNEAFSFIGQSAFSGVAGQLRFVMIDARKDSTLIQGDLNGDRVADFEIEIVNRLVNIQASDVVL